MAGNVADLKIDAERLTDGTGKYIGELWHKWNRARDVKIEDWKELRDYVFATDTRNTSNKELPWKNSTTTPKLCQIRDNLHANYMSALFPNRNWLVWDGDTEEDEAKAKMIEGFMLNQVERSNFRNVVSQLLYDYIDYGMPFVTSEYVREVLPTGEGQATVGYEGPKALRISPYDIVFNPLATDFYCSPKIIRSLKTLGELEDLAKTSPESMWGESIAKLRDLRKVGGQYTTEDWHKATGIAIDGFGDMHEYLNGAYVEVLDFRGDYYDSSTQTHHANYRIVVIDRCITVYQGPNETWAGRRDIISTCWRNRPDNLYGMGPLDNLVGMQYRIDHLENLKADAMDLAVLPPLAIYGQVEPFFYAPGVQVSIPEMDGKIEELGKNLSGIIAAANEIATLEQKMEEFAGAPKQAMGIRTPGEKTMFEVQTLEAASGRIFQQKIVNFEVNVLEPLLNLMFAQARQYMTGTAIAKVHNNEFDMQLFLSITPADVNGNGTLRPRGARHFAEQAILIQNVTQLLSSPAGAIIKDHISTEKLAKMYEDLFSLHSWGLIRKNQGLAEQAEKASFIQNLQQQVDETNAVPPPGSM